MKVYNLISRETEEYDNGYAVRLIEQGKAVPVQSITEGPPKDAAKAAKAGGK